MHGRPFVNYLPVRIRDALHFIHDASLSLSFMREESRKQKAPSLSLLYGTSQNSHQQSLSNHHRSHLRAFFFPAMSFLRGLRPRSDQKVAYAFAVALGAASGWYTYHERNADVVAAYHERNAVAAAAAAEKPK